MRNQSKWFPFIVTLLVVVVVHIHLTKDVSFLLIRTCCVNTIRSRDKRDIARKTWWLLLRNISHGLQKQYLGHYPACMLDPLESTNQISYLRQVSRQRKDVKQVLLFWAAWNVFPEKSFLGITNSFIEVHLAARLVLLPNMRWINDINIRFLRKTFSANWRLWYCLGHWAAVTELTLSPF